MAENYKIKARSGEAFSSEINDGAPCFLPASDLGQLGSADERVGLPQQSPPGTLVVVRAVVDLSVAVLGTEVATASTTTDKEIADLKRSPPTRAIQISLKQFQMISAQVRFSTGSNLCC